MKLTKRKGFNFFRSYYDVYNELSNLEKVKFIDALLDRQFLGVKPTNMEGMSKFAYISQTNSIDSQVKGYEDKTGTKLNQLYTPTIPPTAPPCYGGQVPPTAQVQVEVQEKGKGEYTLLKNPDILPLGIKTTFYRVEDFLKDFNELRVSMKRSKVSNINSIRDYTAKAEFKELSKIYKREDFVKAIKALFKQQQLPNGNTVMFSDPKHLLLHFSRYLDAFENTNDALYGENKKEERL